MIPAARALLPLVLVASALMASAAMPPSSSAPVLVELDYAGLLAIRAELDSPSPPAALAAARSVLVRKADGLLPLPAGSVMEKTSLPPSGDRHDFYATGKYAWPNPDTSDGMPWIRRDGYSNPDAWGPDYDRRRLGEMRTRIATLGLAFFYSRDERHAAKAAELLRVWFIDPATRMNPNLDYSSAQPGVHDGMPIGIIEGVDFIRMLDSVKLIAASRHWTPADDAALRRWFSDFTTWLVESPFGRKEAAESNNHGAWHAAQVAAFSLYAGDTGRLTRTLEHARRLIAAQIAPDGTLPRELVRNRSFWYSLYGLRAFVTLARCGDAVGDDLWHYRTSDGRGIETAFNRLIPYLTGAKPWPRKHLDKMNAIEAAALPLMRGAADVYRTPELGKAARYLIDKTGSRNSLQGRLRYLPAGS
ncbi:Alginate lyase [Opitutaceae bacterium TAV5]|nr:Alginate lyase [Opitutaceae bacterium TAV5]